MALRFARLWNPARYQGRERMKGYFEGWYFKLADASDEHILALIPGISFDRNGVPTAFIQVVHPATETGRFFTFRGTEFQTSKGFRFDIGTNRFGAAGIDINLSDDAMTIRGDLRFSPLHPWPVGLFSPGAMGWYAFVPSMECYHGVLSFDHELRGKLDINGEIIDFTEGRGYIEKDWGRSFPRYHIWLQTNHFETPGTSLMVSIANIPWRGNYFDGVLAGLWHEGKLYRLATYTGAKLTRLDIGEDEVQIGIASKQHRLKLRISRPGVIELRAPAAGAMEGRLSESLTAVTSARLTSLADGEERVIFEGNGKHTGLELSGTQEDFAGIKTEPV